MQKSVANQAVNITELTLHQGQKARWNNCPSKESQRSSPEQDHLGFWRNISAQLWEAWPRETLTGLPMTKPLILFEENLLYTCKISGSQLIVTQFIISNFSWLCPAHTRPMVASKPKEPRPAFEYQITGGGEALNELLRYTNIAMWIQNPLAFLLLAAQLPAARCMSPRCCAMLWWIHELTTGEQCE